MTTDTAELRQLYDRAKSNWGADLQRFDVTLWRSVPSLLDELDALRADLREYRDACEQKQELLDGQMDLWAACQPYMKAGETPAECIKRNRDDANSTLEMLANERAENERLEGLAEDRRVELVRVTDDLMRQLKQANAKVQAMQELLDIGEARNTMAIDQLRVADSQNERLRARLAQVEETHPPEGYPGIAHDMETLRAENAKLADAHLGQMQRGNDLFVECESLRAALRIIAGQEQCIDNLMSNVDVARAALTPTEEKPQ